MIFLGIDLGASSVKVLAVDQEGNILGEASREYLVHYPKSNWAEQNPEDWWVNTKEAIKELISKSNIPSDKVRSIGFSGQMHGLVALDESNNVLFPAILWCDQRTTEECEDITNHFGQEKLTELVGNKALTGFTAPKILWVKKNKQELFEKIRHILLPKDYIRFKLTGDYATDVSDASGMLLLDVENRTWSQEMIEYMGIDKDCLPKLYESYEITGNLTKEVKEELGLSGDVLVVGGAGDNAAGAIGTGTVKEGTVMVTLGTSGVVFAAHDEYAVDSKNRLHAFCHSNGKYHSMGVMLSAASCLKWWVEEANKGMDFDELLNEAALSKLGCDGVIFLPYLMGERTPYADPNAKGTFLGLSMTSTRGDMTRAVLEGVAFGLRDSLEILKDIKVNISQIIAIGGGSKSPLWKQILADIFGQTIEEINTNQGGALGAAILAGVGAGEFKTIEEACTKFIKVVGSVKPIDENVKRYNKIHKIYTKAYESLKDWFELSANI
ncbi:MAG: xylulokinase [Epulopiscium sp.]|nr:xylulokinase [Candidatus Epulonipiscium sp.]